MAAFTLQLPQVTEATLDSASERRRIMGYLYQLSEQLRYTLAHLDDENLSPGGVGLPSLSGEVSRLIASKASGEELRTAIEQTTTAISLLASRDTTDALGARLTSAESSLVLQATQIALRVTEGDVTDMLAAADDKVIRTSAVTIDAGGVEIESTGTIALKSGGAMLLESGSDMSVAVDGDAKLTIDDNGLSADVVRAESISAPNLILMRAGGVVSWRGSLQATLDSMEKYLTGDCTITAQADANGLTGDTGAVTVKDFIGGMLQINLAGVTLAHPLSIMDCGSVVCVQGTADAPGIIAPQTADARAVRVLGSTACLNHMRITGAPRAGATGGTQAGVSAIYGANVFLTSCTIERTTARAIDAMFGCRISLTACRGGQTGGAYDGVANLGYMAVLENNCTLSQTETVPSSALGVYSLRGAVYGTADPLNSEGAAPVITTQTVTYTTSAYGRLTNAKYASLHSAEWAASYPRQGEYSGNVLYGCWILGNASSIAATLNGKTITGVTLKLERSQSYGGTVYANVDLYSHAWTALPTTGTAANPETRMTRVGILSPIEHGETIVYDLSAELAAEEYAALKTGLQDGTIMGFGLSRYNVFMQMTGVCELTVTYEG